VLHCNGGINNSQSRRPHFWSICFIPHTPEVKIPDAPPMLRQLECTINKCFRKHHITAIEFCTGKDRKQNFCLMTTSPMDFIHRCHHKLALHFNFVYRYLRSIPGSHLSGKQTPQEICLKFFQNISAAHF
jgi:hypothetical protein